MQSAIDWLVFDLGGVLVDVADPGPMIAELAARSATPVARVGALLRERFIESPFSLAEQFQTGALDTQAFHRELNAALERPIAFDTLIAGLESMLLGTIPETVRLLERLATSWRLACYSNTNPVHWQWIGRHLDFITLIERPFVSHQIGYAKPDPRGYAAVAHALDAPPGACMLIDDRPVNIDGALKAGWQAYHFETAGALQRLLESRPTGVVKDTPP